VGIFSGKILSGTSGEKKKSSAHKHKWLILTATGNFHASTI